MTSTEDLRRQYELAVAEYRFQVDLNWRRSEYFFVLNVGVLIAATSLLSSHDIPRALVAFLFAVGALLAGLSFLANDAQRSYYRSARDLKGKLEGELALGDLALATTPGMGSGLERLGRVGTFLKIMLVAIAAVDLAGASISVSQAFGGSDVRATQVVIEAKASRPFSALVVSRNGEALITRNLGLHQPLRPIPLEAGRYEVSLAGSPLCRRPLEVSAVPLQIVKIRC